ncbi:MAG: hypothetical protein Greene101449_1296, partial [Candidatus Peregrinibacteria bacterium Greene1014_49]
TSPENSASPKKHAFSLLPSFFRSLIVLHAEQVRIRKLFAKHPQIRLIIVAGDRNVGIETALIAEGNRRNIPSLIVPFAMSFPEAAAEPRLRIGRFQEKYGVHTLPRKILRHFFPSWVRVHKGTPMFFHPAWTGLAAWFLGMMPKKPWIIGGGYAALMAAESEAIKRDLIDQGMTPEKLVVTGKAGLDAIAEQLRTVRASEKRKVLGIPDSMKVILCSVPQLAEHDLLSWDRHKQEMEFLFQTMAATGAYVLISLHPKSDRAWYQPLTDNAGVHINDERIYQLLPICDLFVATYSSTVAQAIALHKPSIVVDFYDLQYPLYANAPGVTVLRDREKFLPLMKNILTDANLYDAYVRAQKEHGTEWALLDGKNTERVIAVAEELMKKHPVHP